MPDRKRILLTNDDGHYSDGINALFSVLSRQYDVYLVAPDREQSASSHSLTLNRPLRVQKLDARRFATDGTPTDCVMLAVHLLFKKNRPDMIISGINHGGNMGDDITYSGTAAAAIEGAILKIPSLAVSMFGWEPGMPMIRAANFITRFLKIYDSLEIDPSSFLNINLPPDTGRPYKSFEFTRQGVRTYRDIVVHKTDPRGKPYYWIGGKPRWQMIAGSDFEAIHRGVVSVTPMKLDFTNTASLERLRRKAVKR